MFGAPTGITMLSDQRMQPSVGIRQSTSSLSISSMSPDQPIDGDHVAVGQVLDVVVAGEAAKLTRVDGLLELVDLPSHSSLVASAGSIPSAFSISGIVSRISVST